MSNDAANQNDVGEKTFAEGDLGRVQGLLFGDQFDAINARIDSLESMLLDSITAVRAEMKKELSSTDRKIDRTKTQLDKRIVTKIDKETDARKSAFVSLADQSEKEFEDLKSELASKATTFEKSLDALKVATDKAMAASRSALEKKIQNTEETLSTSKLDRLALADLLAATAEQIAGEEKSGPKKIAA